MAPQLAPSDVLLAVMGAPHTGELTTTVLRLTQALLDQQGSVQVWTCGYATMLTQETLGASKPRNVVAWTTDYPSSLTLVGDLLTAYPDTLRWYSCRFCSEERGATHHLPAVRLRPPFKFGEHVAAARRTLVMGVI